MPETQIRIILPNPHQSICLKPEAPFMKENNQLKIQQTLYYHERTKHHFYRFARSVGYLDWETQPNPFRFYQGTRSLHLPLLEADLSASYLDLYERKNSKPYALVKENLGAFLELSLGLSAWKSVESSSWALRINPSSGNLHPTEGHLILPPIAEFPAGVYHYAPYYHAIELRAEIPTAIWGALNTHFETPGFLLGLKSIFWRESWKYGERAFRYCNHDVGHALACLSFAANLLGWKVIFLNALSDEEIRTLFGFHTVDWKPHEEEHPELLCFVSVNPGNHIPRHIPESVIESLGTLAFDGEPNPLSPTHVDWDIITSVAKSTEKPKTEPMVYALADPPLRLPDSLPHLSASQIIRQRRSAVQLDGTTSIGKERFLCMLDKTLPRRSCAPFDVELGEPCVHLLLFVHRVDGFPPGIYFLIRNLKDLSEIKTRSRSEFSWEPASAGLPLFLLKLGDFRDEAALVSCQQEIASDGAFSLGMIARFKKQIDLAPYFYRHLFWETGMIGQVLYLEAEAHGIRGTGIGCFYDDPVHQILGFSDNTYQSLYHFTMGGPIEDTRLTTWSPYHHLSKPENQACFRK